MKSYLLKMLNGTLVPDQNGNINIPPPAVSDVTGLNTALSTKVDKTDISQDIETDKASTTKVSSVKQIYDWGANKFLDKSSAQDVTGVKTFLSGMFDMRNTANTFTSFFSVVVTTSRTWTLPDKNGTVAMTSDIVAQLNGTVNRLVKFGTATTGTNSRITDTGSYLGVDTKWPLTKDLAFGYEGGHRNIGVEDLFHMLGIIGAK